jgi:RNA-directed DNA polymerase
MTAVYTRSTAAAGAFQVGGRAVIRRSLRRPGVTPRDVGYAGISAREIDYASRRTSHAGRARLEHPPLSLPDARTSRLLAGLLARSFLSGPWEPDGLVTRGGELLGRRRKWLGPLAVRVLQSFPAGKRPVAARLAEFLRDDPGFRRGCLGFRLPRRAILRTSPSHAAEMCPAPGPPGSWPVPPITSQGELAAFLDLEPARLLWLADCQERERKARIELLRNYRYRWVAKASGSLRLIESPKPMLKRIQRRLLDEILLKIPAHEAAHGFRPGRSVSSFVAPHVGRRVVLKMDLRDFFPSITAARVLANFMTTGYPEDVARLMAGLCTNTVPRDVMRAMGQASPARVPEAWRSRRLFDEPHLPQGAPTSPALANLCAFRLDARLHGLADAAGADYTRYADDLVFSGDDEFARSVRTFHPRVAAIALEEGLAVQHHKTRVMKQGVRQKAAGVVLNRHPNVPREDYDRLKATLHNCLKHGPSGQDRGGQPDFRAHLLGRIAHVAVINPARGERLKRIFDRIAW